MASSCYQATEDKTKVFSGFSAIDDEEGTENINSIFSNGNGSSALGKRYDESGAILGSTFRARKLQQMRHLLLSMRNAQRTLLIRKRCWRTGGTF